MSAGEARIDLRNAALFDRPTQSFLPVEHADGDGASAIGPLALADGEVLGHYRVLRCLGRGGMGEVFEAEDLRSGARVAIKASTRPLDGEADRARFLREGRLAAAISHPNVVYVFAADECRGVPVIVTELVTGGTLRDLVEGQGRLTAMEAVDLMRQVAAGLDAAAREGVVHRDVKPSNCFIDAGGQVKIGDFGLAISALEAAARPRGAGIEGTLAFASPEQLRGEPPDERSDVYSAGATLYFLLTGRPPFAGADGIRLIAHALRDPTPSVRRARPDVARGLDWVVRRCLAKDPAGRPQSHADLSRLLLPFGSTSSTPATLGFRALAGVVDVWVLRSIEFIAVLAAVHWAQQGPGLVAMVLGCVLVILYYGVCETVWGASPGKRIFGLRVVTTGLRSVDGRQAFIRAGLWTLATLPGGLAWLVLGPQTLSAMTSGAGLSGSLGAYGGFLIGFGLLFATARTRNGFAGLHELLTGTRVVSRLVFESGPVRPRPLPPPIVSAGAPRLAHYVILDEAAPPGVVVGYDEALARRVWIRQGTPGAPPVPLARRQVSRPSRLHWLAGGRDDGTVWDVYEMAAGETLRGACGQPRSWRVVRGWLFDLADEIVAAGEDGTDVPLTSGRVWVTDARATLLDWDTDPDGGAPPSPTVARFLDDIARTGLGQGAEPVEGPPRPEALPLHAQAFLTELAAGRVGTADDAVEQLRALSTRRVTVTRARRGVHLATCAAAPLICVAWFLLLVFVVLPILARSPDAAAAEQARALASSAWLGWLPLLGVVLGLIAASALAGLVSSLVVPGGIVFRLLDLAVVGPDGRAVTRARGVGRAAIAWIPALVSLGLFVSQPSAGTFGAERHWLPSLVLLALFVAGGLLALNDPRRGLQDRIAGTSLVPR